VEALEWIRLAGCCGPVDLAAAAAGAIVAGFGALGALGAPGAPGMPVAAGLDVVLVGLPAACDFDAAAVLTGSISTVTFSRLRSPV
jgi:hypothetical protein